MRKTKADENSSSLSLQVAITQKNTKITRLRPVHNIRLSERCNWKCIQNDLDARHNMRVCWNRNYFYSSIRWRASKSFCMHFWSQRNTGKLRYAHSSVYCEPAFIRKPYAKNTKITQLHRFLGNFTNAQMAETRCSFLRLHL